MTDIKALDAAATQGAISLHNGDYSGLFAANETGIPMFDAESYENAAFIAALINAYRSGELIPTPPTPDVAEAARVILDNRWGGYGNRGAMHAMWNFIHDERDARPFPVSFYDGVFQAALAALAEGRK